jgi:hypothetical protein
MISNVTIVSEHLAGKFIDFNLWIQAQTKSYNL